MSEAHSGVNNPRYGVKVSEETKQKISKAHQGQKDSEATRKRKSESARKSWAKRKERIHK